MKIIKYKQFNEHKANTKLEEDIQDIFIELKDKGFEVDTKAGTYSIKVTLYKGGNTNIDRLFINAATADIKEYVKRLFKTDYIKEYVIMLNDYIEIKYNTVLVEYDYSYMNVMKDREDYNKFPDGELTDKFIITFWLYNK